MQIIVAFTSRDLAICFGITQSGFSSLGKSLIIVDLIVMATRGRTGAKRLFLGSVAESAVRSAPCSVLVVR